MAALVRRCKKRRAKGVIGKMVDHSHISIFFRYESIVRGSSPVRALLQRLGLGCGFAA